MSHSVYENRKYPRYSYPDSNHSPSLTIYSGNSSMPIHAQVRDISQGGLGVRADYQLVEDEVIRCSLNFPGVPVSIPTLMRVRWSINLDPTYLSGLEFLL